MKKVSLSRKDFLIGLFVGVAMSIVICFTFDLVKNVTNCHDDSFIQDRIKPHSPYLAQRDTLDGGFSRGWMPHFLPSEEYWIDVHVHLDGISDANGLKHLLDEWFARLDAFRLGKVVAITDDEKMFRVFGEAAEYDLRFAWMYWPEFDAPSVSQIREAVHHGACALKLHNAAIMAGKIPRHVWLNDEWQAIFAYAENTGLPVLWHVTQRHGYSPYHGGGVNSYWQYGWAAGVDFTNEDLLHDMLMLMKRFPKLKVIGAHQLHVGLDRLSELFKEYENLYIDSSCGMYLRWADDFIEEDRKLLCEFVETWSERIIFGTDAGLFPGSIDEYAIQGFLCHERFFLKLGISDKALQDVAWRTAQQLLNMKPGQVIRRGNVRP